VQPATKSRRLSVFLAIGSAISYPTLLVVGRIALVECAGCDSLLENTHFSRPVLCAFWATFGIIPCGQDVDMSHSGRRVEIFSINSALVRSLLAHCNMSVLDDFIRMRLYRERASEFEILAEIEPLSSARFRYRMVARHYRELANREERSDKARIAEHLNLLRLKRRKAAE